MPDLAEAAPGADVVEGRPVEQHEKKALADGSVHGGSSRLPNVRLGDGFAVSADGRWVLYVKRQAQVVDLMPVENFR
jgi:hypothetical protein